jgi:hypothetical protein
MRELIPCVERNAVRRDSQGHPPEFNALGWYAVLEDPKMPARSTLLDQAHHAMDRK